MKEQTFRTTFEAMNRQIETLKDSIGTGIYEQFSREIDTLGDEPRSPNLRQRVSKTFGQASTRCPVVGAPSVLRAVN